MPPSAPSNSDTPKQRLKLSQRLRKRVTFTPSNRSLVLMLILSAWLLVIGLGKLLPWVSALMLLFVIMFTYMSLLTIRLFRGDTHRPSEPDVKAEEGDFLPKVSILVAAHDEAAVIGRLVTNLASLDYPNYDVLILDDRSGDGTYEAAQQAVEQLEQAQVTAQSVKVYARPKHATPGKSAVLNEGLTMTDGDILAVFDADAVVPKDLIARLVPFFANPVVGGAQARKVVSNPSINCLTRCQYFEMAMDTYIQAGRDTIGGAVEFRGNGELVRRDAVESVGGWNEKSVTDDLDLSTRFQLAGWEIRFDPLVEVYEEAITDFVPLLKQRRRWAEGSLVRYLEFAPAMLKATGVSLRAKADLVAYIIEFLFPLWVLTDYAYLFFAMALNLGDPHHMHILMSLMLLPALGLFFYGLLIAAIHKFENQPLLPSLGWGLATSIYLVLVWVPVSLWVVFKLLIQKEPSFDWGKTIHQGYSEVHTT